eukprot:COSAG02_NODE_1734_length_11163_cov_43.814262_9_plen_386_part_00
MIGKRERTISREQRQRRRQRQADWQAHRHSGDETSGVGVHARAQERGFVAACSHLLGERARTLASPPPAKACTARSDSRGGVRALRPSIRRRSPATRLSARTTRYLFPCLPLARCNCLTRPNAPHRFTSAAQCSPMQPNATCSPLAWLPYRHATSPALSRSVRPSRPPSHNCPPGLPAQSPLRPLALRIPAISASVRALLLLTLLLTMLLTMLLTLLTMMLTLLRPTLLTALLTMLPTLRPTLLPTLLPTLPTMLPTLRPTLLPTLLTAPPSASATRPVPCLAPQAHQTRNPTVCLEIIAHISRGHHSKKSTSSLQIQFNSQYILLEIWLKCSGRRAVDVRVAPKLRYAPPGLAREAVFYPVEVDLFIVEGSDATNSELEMIYFV